MQYRLICIINPHEDSKYLEVEVCLDTGKRTISPFIRRATINELLKSCAPSQLPLAKVLFRTGISRQPFTLAYEQLKTKEISDVLSSHIWLYTKSQGKNVTLKRVHSIIPFLPKDNRIAQYEKGKLICGELYISDPSCWWRNIDVRVRYDQCLPIFPIEYTYIPFFATDNSWRIRDIDAEGKLLARIYDLCDIEASTLNVDPNEFSVLKGLYESGWKIYIRNSSSAYETVSYRKDKYGIEWFDSDHNDTSDLAEGILNSYLNNRNFLEYNGRIQIYNKQSVNNLSPKNTAQTLAPNLGLDRLYENRQELLTSETKNLKYLLSQRVRANLKPYQIEGVLWLHTMRKNGLGCMLADDMGLGKTLQTIAHLVTIDIDARHLIVCPASITENWLNEIKRFTPDLDGAVKVISYENLRRNIESFLGVTYDTVVADEGQYVKNDGTKRHSVISQLNRKHTIILSGTPIENSIHEIWSQFALLIPEIKYLEKRLLGLGIAENNAKWAELSKSLLSPFILRRTKEEVLPSLPDLYEQTITVDLNPEERHIYESIRSAIKSAISSGISGRVNSIALEGLLRLRQCCVSANLLPKYLSNRSAIISTKIKTTVEMTKDFVSTGHKVLIFSQFTTAIHELRTFLDDEHIESLLLSGETRKRQELIDKFQGNDSIKVFCISLKAGGTGLNLTSADRVILLDDWWNPAVENQAFARAHRIGQMNNVEIYRIICRGTIEEKILEIHKIKKEITDVFNIGTNKLTFEQITELINY